MRNECPEPPMGSPYYKWHVFICTNQKAPGKVCCANSGGQAFFDYMKKSLKKRNMHGPGKVRVTHSGCLGRCKLGPCMVIYPEGVWYTYETFADLDEIIEGHFLDGRIIERLLLPSSEPKHLQSS